MEDIWEQFMKLSDVERIQNQANVLMTYNEQKLKSEENDVELLIHRYESIMTLD